MEPWIRNDLRPPPNISTKVKRCDIDVNSLMTILGNAVKILNFKFVLHKEAALFSRYLYRIHRRHNNHKMYLFLRKVKRGLQRYLSLNLDYIYNNIYSFITVDDSDMFEEFICAPSKQMLEYLLIRTQSFCKIMYYIMVACQDSAPHVKDMLKRAFCSYEMLVGLAIISRIWYCAKYYVMCACQWYDQLLPFLKKLQVCGLPWLPEGYEFPKNLRIWLGPNPMTGEIISDVADVQKITREIKRKYDSTDIGEEIKRDQLLNYLQREEIPESRFLKSNVMITKYDKLLTMAANIPSDSHKSFNETQEVIDQPNPSTSQFQDTGEIISRDEYSQLKLKDKNVSVKCSKSVLEAGSSSSKFDSANSHLSKASSSKLCKNLQNIAPRTKNVKISKTSTTGFLNTGSSEDMHDWITAGQSVESSSNNHSVCKDTTHNVEHGKNKKTSLNIPVLDMQPDEKYSNTIDLASSGESPLTKPLHSTSAGAKKKKKHSVETGVSLQKISDNSNTLNDKIQIHPTHTSLYKNAQSKTFHDPKSVSASNSKQNTTLVLKYPSTLEQKSEVPKSVAGQKQLVNKKKKKKKLPENMEVINGIKTVNDVKVFLHSQKKARAKGKMCVTSGLSEDDWKILLDATSKMLKKASVLKLKGKQTKSVIKDIQNTFMSFI